MLTVRDATPNEDGTDTEHWAVQIPAAVEAEGPAAIDAHVAAVLATRANPPANDPPSTEEG